jgi:hypothetical protein
MSFAFPSALAFAALAAPIIVFYILKIRLRRVPVSTTIFWRQIFDEKPPRSIWQTLRHLLSLLIQLIMLCLLVLAIADPYFSWQLLQARRVVLVVDNSASMSAADVLPTRLAAAKAAGLTTIDGLRFRDELAVVVAGAQPEVVVGMSGHIPTLKRAVEEIQPTDGPTALAQAIELARRLIGDHPHGQIVVLTDACTPEMEAMAREGSEVRSQESGVRGQGSEVRDWNLESGAAAEDRSPSAPTSDLRPPTAFSRSSPIQIMVFGGDTPNAGITQFQVRRSLLDPLGYEVLVAVRNASDQPLECRLELELDEVPVDVLPLKLAAEETWSRSLEKTSLEGGRLVARLITDDALSADNSAWAILPGRERQRVFIVSPGNLFLQKVFEANPLVDVEVTKQLPDEWPRDALIVLHREIPSTLPSGDVWVVDPAGSCDLWDLGGDLENPIVTEQDKDSSLMTHVRLDNVLMPQARKLTFKSKPRVLAGALSGDPIYAALQREEGKVLVLTVNIDEGDLAFRTAFPILVTNSLGWFAGESGELRESLTTGSVTQVTLSKDQVPANATLKLLGPDGTETPLALPSTPKASGDDPPAAAERQLTIGPLQHAGVWQVTATEENQPAEVIEELACNLASAAEADLRTPEAWRQTSVEERGIAAWFTRPLWFYLAIAAWLLTTVEWFLYQRRHIT